MSRELPPLEVRGVLLPLHNGQLLIPNANLSEVIGYRPPETAPPSALPWLLGIVNWRQRPVPLVSFESLLGTPMKAVGQRARIAMCYSLRGTPARPFTGILLRSVPRLVRVTEASITPLGKPGELGPMVAGRLQIAGQEAWIPDFDNLEQALADSLD